MVDLLVREFREGIGWIYSDQVDLFQGEGFSAKRA
jgi:hypothetical protein